MSIAQSIAVFLISLVVLVVEAIQYYIIVVGNAYSVNNPEVSSSLAFFFVGLMLFTWIAGVLFPICVILAEITNNNRFIKTIFLSIVTIMLCGYFGTLAVRIYKAGQDAKKANMEAKSLSNMPARDDQRDYIKKYLMLQDIKVDSEYGQIDVIGKQSPKKGVTGSVKNIGDKSIGFLEITIYFLDPRGRRLGEKSYRLIEASSMLNRSAPLEPNYTKDFGYLIEGDAPPGWSGKIEAVISEIKFERK